MNDDTLVLPVVIPLLSAVATLLWPRRAAWLGMAGASATLIAAASIAARVVDGDRALALGGWTPGLGIALRADPLAAVLLSMSAAVVTVAGLYATAYFARNPPAYFWPLWLLLTTALNASFLSADLFNVYVTLELLGLSAVALTALGGSADAVRAASRYLLVGLLGSLAFLAGVALMYAAYGTLDMRALAAAIRPEPAAWSALALLTAGLLVKCALFPLHFWLPPAHANAPAPISAALSALVVKAAFYLVVRLWLELFGPVVTPGAAELLGVLGAAAVLWGAWNALTAPRLKLVAAYSTVAQVGYLFLFFPLLTSLPAGAERDTAFGALVLLALTHGFAKSGLFLAAGVIQQHAGHDRIAELGGTARALPLTTFSFALAGIALVGLPPSGTFVAKWQLLAAAIATGQWAWVVVVGAGTLLAAAYVFRVLGNAFAPGEPRERLRVAVRLELPPLLLALIATGLLGLGSALIWQLVVPGAFSGGRAS